MICCRIVRRYLSIKSLLISLLFTFFMTTIPDNIESYFTMSDFRAFSNSQYFLIFMPIWLLFNYFPYDIIYNLSNILSPILALFTGLLNARCVCKGIDIFLKKEHIIIEAVLGGIMFSFGKYLVLYTFSRMIKHKMRSIYVILFELFFGALIYISITDINQHNTRFLLKRSEARVLIISLSSIFEITRNYVKDHFFGYIWNCICYVISLIIPYYGATWIPNQVEFT